MYLFHINEQHFQILYLATASAVFYPPKALKKLLWPQLCTGSSIMKQALTILLVALASWSAMAQQSPLAQYSAEWNNPKYLVCNTAKNTSYLSEKEKEIIYILNLARMNPQLFCETVVSQAREICNADTTSEHYYKSLVATLMAMEPAQLLNPDTVCYSSAKAHAIASGQSGYTGHERQTAESRSKKRFNGECCHYGSSSPIFIVMDLLVDEGVASLGHRRICLNDYSKMAVSMQPHKSFGTNTVLDFLY